MAVINLELVSYDGLDERIAIIRAGDEVDSVFVCAERFNVLVDTLATPALCAQAMDLLADRIHGKPLVVINSHMDWDHFWGNAALDAHTPVIAHSAAIERLRGPDAGQELAKMRSQDARFLDVEIVPPTITFPGERMSLHGGDLTLELLHTPGHTPDHIAVWIPELLVCLAVDAVEYPIPCVWSQSPDDLRRLCTSLKKIRDLCPRHVIPAHGQVANPEIVDGNIAYFAGLRDAVASAPRTVSGGGGLDGQPGFMLEDFVALSPAMPTDTIAFYRQCHRSNLGAVVAASSSGVDFV